MKYATKTAIAATSGVLVLGVALSGAQVVPLGHEPGPLREAPSRCGDRPALVQPI